MDLLKWLDRLFLELQKKIEQNEKRLATEAKALVPDDKVAGRLEILVVQRKIFSGLHVVREFRFASSGCAGQVGRYDRKDQRALSPVRVARRGRQRGCVSSSSSSGREFEGARRT